MKKAGVKRLFETAAVTAAEGGFMVTLDGRPALTPGGASLTLPGRALAAAVAAEWAAQGEEIRPHTMPFTGLANSAVDGVAPDRRAVVEHAVKYAATDLLCYRANNQPELARRQHAEWQPLLDWAGEALGAPLAVTEGIAPVDQPAAALDALGAAVEALGDLELAALSSLTAACGSLVLALALAAGRIGAGEAYALSQLDETYQIEKWGADAEAVARCDRLCAEIAAAAAFLELVRG
ncbi:MAG TPA: ATP12 family protein [Rhodospirillales bacterium]|nr:ATP12 family protein [Rhodospirillales bacterium]